MGTSAKKQNTLHYRILVFYLKRLFEIKFLSNINVKLLSIGLNSIIY